jgi:hypothetical protein
MSLCVIKESKVITGTNVKVKNWKEVLKEQKYSMYRDSAIKILQLAEKHRIYCPDIYISEDVLCIKYEYENRFLIFYIYHDIQYNIGTKNGEDFWLIWNEDSKMNTLSSYLYAQYNNSDK